MNISEVSVRRPVLVTMIFVLVSTVASIFLPKLDIALYPSVSMPMLYVSVSCNDAGPEEIELQVAQLLEKQLGSIEGLESITTSSSSGRCTALLEFSYIHRSCSPRPSPIWFPESSVPPHAIRILPRACSFSAGSRS